MLKLLSGRTAVVTGAGRGIGSSVARLFAEQGARVVVHHHSSGPTAEELSREIGGIAIQADLRDPAQAQRLMEEAVAAFGSIDILVNNAASFIHKNSFDEEIWDDYLEQWNGVFGATFHPIKSTLPFMKEQGRGRIINFAATLVQRPAVGYGAHTCAKAAVLALSRNLARELGPFGITVNVVSPGMTLTDFTNSLPEREREKVSSITPLRRLAEAGDVASLCLFYASDMAQFITGANTAPDGGLATL